MKKIALDTNIAISLLNGDEEIVQNIKSFDSIYLPITVCGELLFGAKNSAKSHANRCPHFIEIISTVKY